METGVCATGERTYGETYAKAAEVTGLRGRRSDEHWPPVSKAVEPLNLRAEVRRRYRGGSARSAGFYLPVSGISASEPSLLMSASSRLYAPDGQLLDGFRFQGFHRSRFAEGDETDFAGILGEPPCWRHMDFDRESRESRVIVSVQRA